MKNKVQDLNLSSGMQQTILEKEFQLDYTSTPLKPENFRQTKKSGAFYFTYGAFRSC